jgi:hypothetical protein
VIRIWNWLKDYVGYVYAAIFVGLAVFDVAHDGVTWWLAFDLVVAAVLLFIYQCPLSPFVKPKTYAIGRAAITVGNKVDMAKAEVPPPPPPAWLADHRQEIPDCSLCKQWGWDKL